MIVKKRVKAQRANNGGGKSPFWVTGLEQRKAPLDERALAIFQPDILIEPQFQSTFRRRYHLGPERVLMLAVLQDAVTCFQDHVAATCKRKQAMHRDAEQWIMSDDQSYLFSFENVCEALGYEAAYIRRGLLRWKEQAVGGGGGKKGSARDPWPAQRAASPLSRAFYSVQSRRTENSTQKH
jgi:hypothetical protein